MSDAISKALAAAEQEAANTPETPISQPASPPAMMGAGSVPATAGASRSLLDFMNNASMNVDCYLGVSDLGIRFGKDKQLHDEILVEMCFKNAKPGWTLRVNTAGGVVYLQSRDGITEDKSRQNWQAVVADAKKMDPKSYVSDSVELPVRLLADYKRKEAGPLAAGTLVGLSLSYMNGKAFGAFLNEVFPKVGENPFTVKLTAIAKKGGGQDYGVYGYEVVDQAAAPAAAKGGRKAA